ncbi:MAG: glycosyltransferase family 2 protein [Chloroflexi bacterium]|nr:glycosyltransferase family 2 protein [Chloroflexota bacterium]
METTSLTNGSSGMTVEAPPDGQDGQGGTAAGTITGSSFVAGEAKVLLPGYSVVIPAVNEADAVGDVVRRVQTVMTVTSEPYEVIVVDDGSTDETAREAAAAGAVVIQHPHNVGYGAGLKTGITHARFDRIIISDADGTYPIERIPDLLSYAGRFDMVVGARQGQHYRESWRKELSRFALGTMASWVTGTRIPDVNSGFRVFRTALARQYFHVISQGYSFTTTITLAALSNGYFVKYVPIEYNARVGKSKVKLLRDIPRTMQIVFQAVVYYNPIKLFLAFALLCLALALASWLVFALTQSTVAGVVAGLWTVSVVHFVALGLLADLIRVRHVPRAPTLTSQR